MPTRPLPDFLPGAFVLLRGNSRDYHRLARFHYRAGPPATWADVWTLHFLPERLTGGTPVGSTLAAVGVLSYPTALSRARQRHFKLNGVSYGQTLRFVNLHFRTISRIVVHPQFRSLGLACRMVRQLCRKCPTRYVEASAVMGHIVPFFEQAGMTRLGGQDRGAPCYYLFDRAPDEPMPTPKRPQPMMRPVRRPIHV